MKLDTEMLIEAFSPPENCLFVPKPVSALLTPKDETEIEELRL